MKITTRLTAVVLVLVMLLSMTACGCDHEFERATCEEPSTCSLCGETEGEPRGHKFKDATADEPKTCSRCGKTKGKPLGEDGKNDIDSNFDEVAPPVDEYFCIPATGEYSDGIMLPELGDATVTIMMSIDWTYLEANNNPDDPFAQYHATLIWRDVYADQNGDVKIVTIADDQQTEYLATQTASGTAPDLIPANYDLTYPKWSAAGLTDPINKYKDHIELDIKNPNDPSENLYNLDLMSKYFQWNGECHGAITLANVDRNYIVYNKTKFENAGQTDPLTLWERGEWNWTNFVKTAKAMTSGDDYGFTGWGLFPYFAPYPMASLNETTGKVTLNIDDTKYMRYMTEVYNLYQVDKAARCDGSLQQCFTLFPAGTDAMVQTTLSGYKRIVERAIRIDGDSFGIAPVPVFDPTGETESISTATLWAYSISAAAKNPVGAAAYIRLETLVTRNVEAAFEGETWYDKNLTDDEKAMIEATEDDPVCVEMIRGIGECYLGIIDRDIVPAMYYVETNNSVQAIFDAQKNALQAEIDDFNAMFE